MRTNKAAPTPTVDQFVSAVIAQFRSELRDAFAEATAASRKEPGVIAYELSRDAKDATRYVVYERWKSLSDLAAHLRTPYITSLIAALQGILAGPAEFQVLIPAADDPKSEGAGTA